MRLADKVNIYLGQLRHDPGLAELEELIRVLVFHIQRLEEVLTDHIQNQTGVRGPIYQAQLRQLLDDLEQHINNPAGDQSQQEPGPSQS